MALAHVSLRVRWERGTQAIVQTVEVGILQAMDDRFRQVPILRIGKEDWKQQISWNHQSMNANVRTMTTYPSTRGISQKLLKHTGISILLSIYNCLLILYVSVVAGNIRLHVIVTPVRMVTAFHTSIVLFASNFSDGVHGFPSATFRIGYQDFYNVSLLLFRLSVSVAVSRYLDIFEGANSSLIYPISS